LNIFFDREFLAARRAAKCYGSSADPKINFLATIFALHILHKAWAKKQEKQGG